MLPDAQEVLDFWFQPEARQKWFAKDARFDAQITERFQSAYVAAKEGRLKHWLTTPHGLLAYILVLDQFSRNMFRGQAEMFATDALALAATHMALEKKWDEEMELDERRFLYMPLMHSETLEDQQRSVTLFEQKTDPYSAEYARQHQAIITRFGRFPHRNAILGRESTQAEQVFLTEPGSSF